MKVKPGYISLGLVFVLLLVLGVAHLMEYGGEVLVHKVPGAHSDPEVGGVVEVPGGGVTDDVPAVSWFLQHAQLPETLRDPQETQAGVEVVPSEEHFLDSVVLLPHGRARVNRGLPTERLGNL